MVFIVSQVVLILTNRELSGRLINWARVRRRNDPIYLVLLDEVTFILVDFFSDVRIDLNG